MANYLNPMSWFNQESVEDPVQDRNSELHNAINKALTIDRVGDTRSRKTDQLAVSTVNPEWHNNKKGNDDVGMMAFWASPSFRDYLKFNYNTNKHTRINDYRDLAKQEKLEACIHEISISCIASHDKMPAVKASLEGDYNSTIKEIVDEEIKLVLDFFKFEERGQHYFRELLTTGELAFENVFSIKNPEFGILDVKAIPPENIDPIFRNHFNQEIEAFILKKPNNTDHNKYMAYANRVQQSAQQFDTVPMACSQVTYCNSGIFDNDKQTVIPYIVKGQDAQKKISLLEHAVVINAMTNGPERMVWKIPTGNMDGGAKGRYMREIVRDLKKNKGVDTDGNIIDKFNPMSITEDFYIPVGKDGQSADVTRVQGSQAFSNGFNGILTYFHQKVFEDMHVPISRLNPEVAQSDGQTITMQELAFAERVIAIQKIFASAVKKTVITHLKLKGLKLHNESCRRAVLTESKAQVERPVNETEIFESHLKLVEKKYYKDILLEACNEEQREKLLHELGLSYWDQYELNESDIDVEFSLPTTFLALREQQQEDLKWTNFSTKADSGHFSVYLLAKKYLDMTDTEIKQHLAWKKMEAKKIWELTQIAENGPEFRADAQAELAGGDALGGGGGSALGGGASALGDGGDVPDFGGEGGDLDAVGEEPVEEPLPDTEEPTVDEEPVEEV